MIPIERLGAHPDLEPNPWLAVGLIRVDCEEIVGAVFFDHYAGEDGHAADADGVVDVDAEPFAEEPAWYLQVLAEGSPSPIDPRVTAPTLEYVGGGEVSLDSAFGAGMQAVAERGQILNLADAQARERLVWGPRLTDEQLVERGLR